MAPREGQKTNVFAPKDSVPVTIQKYTVNLYPKLPVDASIHKRAHTFFTNKAALDQIKKKIPMRMYLDHLCIQLGCVPSTQGLVHDWTNHFTDNWCHPNQLEILSFHNSNGVVIDASIPGDIQVLRPIQDGPVAQWRPSNVAYAEVCHAIHFSVLEPNEPIAPLAFVFYIKLPQSTTVQVNGQGNNYQLTTFHSDAEIREMEMEAIQATILDITHQDGPYTLSAPGFAQQGAVAGSVKITTESKSKSLVKERKRSVMPFSNHYALDIPQICILLSKPFINWSKTPTAIASCYPSSSMMQISWRHCSHAFWIRNSKLIMHTSTCCTHHQNANSWLRRFSPGAKILPLSIPVRRGRSSSNSSLPVRPLLLPSSDSNNC